MFHRRGRQSRDWGIEEHGMVSALSFGAWVRQRRREQEWTQEALAAQVGCSPALIRKIEAGERRPSRQVAELLVERLAATPAEHETMLRRARQELRGPEEAAALPSLPLDRKSVV